MREETSIDERLEDLTAKAHAAHRSGERIEANRLFAQRDRLEAGEDVEADADLDQDDEPQVDGAD